ncbi:MAG: DUF4097 family beta strand repeat-containing protein [Faecalibacterium sp.]|jgi:hypothetical protein|nr:DUF4097 family beta strand repeat-containing protein [Faecalibacterium sp.]
MNQETFLQQLGAALSPLSEIERARALEYYREMICDELESGRTEEEILAGFGTVADIATQILAENGCAPLAAQDTPAGEPAQPCEGSQTAGYSAASQPGAAPGPAAGQAYAQGENARPCPPPYGFAETVFSPEGAVQQVIVDARNINVELRPVPTGAVRIHIRLTESDDVRVTEQNGVYAFYHKTQFSLFNLRDLFLGPRWILIEVPAGYTGDLEVKTSNGRMEANGLLGLQNVQLATSNGSFLAQNINCVNFGARTSNGSLTLENLQGSHCIAQTSNGHIRADRCAFPDMLHLYTSNGAIQAPNILADDIELSTQNGAISAVICGDMRAYTIHSHTNNASNSLPPDLAFPDQTKRLNVNTSNARIDVRFLAAGRA